MVDKFTPDRSVPFTAAVSSANPDATTSSGSSATVTTPHSAGNTIGASSSAALLCYIAWAHALYH